MVKRGEVWWYEPPDAHRRPYLILTRDAAIPVLNQVLAAPLTRTIRAIPTEVRLGPDDGLPAACVASLDNVTLIRPSLCTDRLTTLGATKLRAACDALKIATGCDHS
jgi:mRNA interferase MazF